MIPQDNSRTPRWQFVVLLVVGVIAVAWLKWIGVVLVLMLVALAYLLHRSQFTSPEIAALHTSIRLSAEDIVDVQEEYDSFLSSTDAETMADRTLHRPALADRRCGHPVIEQFHFDVDASRRFLARLEARLRSGLTVAQLEKLLTVTDERAQALRDSWMNARHAARQLGPGYDND